MSFSGTGLTCIVGPNGCGKSNIVDAISWVLGEQSHKSLRAERMSDCIFNGTAKRPPLGMAEVIIHLEDTELAEAGRFIFDMKDEEAAPQAGAQIPENSEALEATTVVSDGTATMEMAPDPAPPSADADVITELPAEEPSSKENPFSKKKKAAKPVMNVKPGQVVIGRRLYRSGQSEYLINGRVARLRDVQELFMGVGLGPDSYAIIEQGRIGQILSSRPADRRAIIEEAAGVTKYKTKKRLAEAKLEASKLNLNRVNDIVVEVEKQLASLKRQASKARRYAEIREQMRGLLRQVLASKARELDGAAERLTKLLMQVSTAETAEVHSLAALDEEHEQLSQRIDELDAELKQNQNLLGQTTLELDRAENHIAFNRQRGTELDTRTGQLCAQIDQADEQTGIAAAAATSHAESVQELSETARAQELLVSELAAHGQQLSVDTQLAEEHIAALRQSSGELNDQLSQLQTEQAQAEASLALHIESLGRKQAAEQQLLEDSLHHRERDQAAEFHFQASGERARNAELEVQALQTRIGELRHSRLELEARAESARDAAASVRARRKTLEQVLNDRAYTAESVKKLFAANAEAGASGGKNFRAVGLLADYAEVAEAHEAAVEQFLRDELEYVVVETFDHARTGISMLREELGGRATFFVDSLNKLNVMPEDNIIPFPTAEGVISRLDRLVEFKDPLGKAAKHFLPRLKSAWMVETSSAAEKLAREYPAYCFVTPDGTTYQGRMVSGGRAVEAGPLGMKRELRALDGEFVQRESELVEAQEGLERVTSELGQRETDLKNVSAAHVEAEKNFVAASHQRDQARAELVRLSIELRDCQDEIARLQREIKLSEGRAAAAKSQREDATRSRATGEDEIRALGDRVTELRQQAETHQQELSAKREELAAMAERLGSAEALAARLEEERTAAAARAEALRAQLDELAGERIQLEGESAEYARRATALGEEKKRLDARAQSLDAEWNQARNRTAQVDDALRMSRQKLGELREERGHAEVEQAKNESERGHLRESCVSELNAQPEDLIAEFPALLSGEELATADANYREMKSRIDSMGPVNMMALEEYNECDQRFAFLTRERDDLLASIADTQSAITELDEVSRQKFEEAFTKVNANFAEAFRTLFGGGTGEMRLTEPDSSGDAGIDIAAQPPGKRLQNVLLLSGGEKALTALALLIAIFRYQPSPFCILDEVDAPLDEANVGRFADMVAQMGAHTQFIVVTHNRRTMEMAPVMYGVTMQEPGVSKLVSVRWNEEGTQAGSGNAGARAAAASAA